MIVLFALLAIGLVFAGVVAVVAVVAVVDDPPAEVCVSFTDKI